MIKSSMKTEYQKMTTKKWKSLRSGEKPLSAALRKSKMHPKYTKVFSENTVSVLRQKARSAGTKGWYSLRKGNLASAVIIHDAAVTVTNFFRRVVDAKRLGVYESHARNNATCPISLTLVTDLENDDVFVHAGIVFSKQSLLDFMLATVDFRNPVTRTMMHLYDIERLGCPHVLDKYKDRERLRCVKVISIRQFSFLETELENILTSLLQHYYCGDDDFFATTLRAFQQTWREMKRTDRNRTICVLRSLEHNVKFSHYNGRPRAWANNLVTKYLDRTT